MSSNASGVREPVMAQPRKYLRCLVGGTFDRLHSGHEILLRAAIDAAEHVEVWVSDDNMANSKSEQIQSAELRMEGVRHWADKYASGRMHVFSLSDEFGPAATREDCDAIVCTPETELMCDAINDQRRENKLVALAVIVVPHLLDSEGDILSSSRIRAGRIDRSGSAWLSEKARNSIHKMLPELDSEFKQPMGILYEGPEEHTEVALSAALRENPRSGILVAVGDVTVAGLTEMGIVPDIALIDGMTKREKYLGEIDTSVFDFLISAVNPAGVLTPSLTSAIDDALHSDGRVCIQVDGEEDLAPLIIHLLAPLGTLLLYGQPGKGVVARETDEVVKGRCRSLIERFEVIG